MLTKNARANTTIAWARFERSVQTDSSSPRPQLEKLLVRSLHFWSPDEGREGVFPASTAVPHGKETGIFGVSISTGCRFSTFLLLSQRQTLTAREYYIKDYILILHYLNK